MRDVSCSQSMPQPCGHIKLANPRGGYANLLLATWLWQHDYVDREKAMTELLEAVADASREAREQRVLRMAAALYEADLQGVKQVELVKETGLTRETIRRHIEDEKIRRGLIPPTERYLRAKRRAARDS